MHRWRILLVERWGKLKLWISACGNMVDEEFVGYCKIFGECVLSKSSSITQLCLLSENLQKFWTDTCVMVNLEFAKVKFMATMAALLMRYRLVSTKEGGGSEGDAREEIERLIAQLMASMAVNIAELERLWIGLVKR
jgi:hypothetical protein